MTKYGATAMTFGLLLVALVSKNKKDKIISKMTFLSQKAECLSIGSAQFIPAGLSFGLSFAISFFVTGGLLADLVDKGSAASELTWPRPF